MTQQPSCPPGSRCSRGFLRPLNRCLVVDDALTDKGRNIQFLHKDPLHGNRFDRQSTPALKVKQWNSAWDDITWNRKEHRSEPPHYFYQFNLPAGELRRLKGVYERTTNRKTAADDFGIQRQLNKERSSEISCFVEFGYPWSDLSRAKRSSPDFRDLRQPGWLPTSVVVNILVSSNRRRGKTIDDADLIEIVDEDEHTATLSLPHAFSNLIGNLPPSHRLK